MTRIFDYTRACYDGIYRRNDLDNHSLIFIHRIGPGIGVDAVEIARFFVKGEGRKYTGHNMPYHYVNTEDQVQQALPLDERGAHARRWGNTYGIGFAQLGDFNQHTPAAAQWSRAVDVCADLVHTLNTHSAKMLALLPKHLRTDIPIVGHGEVPAAYGAQSGKEHPHGDNACPGRYWNMDEFRRDVEIVMKQRAGEHLTRHGHRFSGHGGHG